MKDVPMYWPDKPCPDFAIFQNDRTRVTGLWLKERGEWVEAGRDEYEIIALLARLLRTSPNPEVVIEEIKKQSLRDY